MWKTKSKQRKMKWFFLWFPSQYTFYTLPPYSPKIKLLFDVFNCLLCLRALGVLCVCLCVYVSVCFYLINVPVCTGSICQKKQKSQRNRNLYPIGCVSIPNLVLDMKTWQQWAKSSVLINDETKIYSCHYISLPINYIQNSFFLSLSPIIFKYLLRLMT